MSETYSDRFENLFSRLTCKVNKAFRYYLSQILFERGHDITAEQMVVLGNLWHRDGLTQQEISEIVEQNKASTTRIIDRLEKRYLVIRVTDKKDRRKNMVYLTALGKERMPEILAVLEKAHADALAGVELDKLGICREVLSRIITNLSAKRGAEK